MVSMQENQKRFFLHLYIFNLYLIINKNTEKGTYLVIQERFSSNIWYVTIFCEYPVSLKLLLTAANFVASNAKLASTSSLQTRVSFGGKTQHHLQLCHATEVLYRTHNSLWQTFVTTVCMDNSLFYYPCYLFQVRAEVWKSLGISTPTS